MLTKQEVELLLELSGSTAYNTTFYKYKDGTVDAVDKNYGKVLCSLSGESFSLLCKPCIDVTKMGTDERQKLIGFMERYKGII